MEKIASQMLDKLKTFAEENPDLVKTTLLAGGIGALGGAMIPSSKEEDEESTATERVGRKLKNALIGATVVGGAGALLSNAAKNFNTAKFQRQLTPEEKTEQAVASVMGVGHNPVTLGGLALTGGLIGGAKDRKEIYGNAESLARQLAEGKLDPRQFSALDAEGKANFKSMFHKDLKGKAAWKALRGNLRELAADGKEPAAADMIRAISAKTGLKGKELQAFMSDAGLQDFLDPNVTTVPKTDIKAKLRRVFDHSTPRTMSNRARNLSEGLAEAAAYGSGKAWRHLKRNKRTYALATALPTLVGLGTHYLEPDIEN